MSLPKWLFWILICTASITFADEQQREKLAKHYSPVIYQHVDTDGAVSLEGKSDLILPFDYDGTWSGDVKWENLDRWENLDDKSKHSTVYYSVIETTNYWFIYYAIYHPRDWTDVNKFNDVGEG
ncbi:MAG: hypothetical protein U9R57_14610, partial [Thermodesulfobacteriota bacterium]|nr:hypothetical protein [Thermodesulfobacteriota bacterium]